MKTHIIKLEQIEDVISVRDKMNWTQANRILLVCPKDGQPLNRKLDLNLLARYAASLGAQLALVSKDTYVLENASSLGIPVFFSARLAQEADWKNSQPQAFHQRPGLKLPKLLDQRSLVHPGTPAWLEHRVIKILCLSISVLALFILGILTLPSAKISFTTPAEQQTMVFDFVADLETNAVNYSTGTLPTYSRDVIVNGHDTMAATGVVSIPAASATGILHFSNNTDQPVTIPSGTIVTTSGIKLIRFITLATADTTLDSDGTIDLPAQAMQAGVSGNLGAYELDTVEGELGKYLEVMNLGAMTGGTEAKVPSPSKDNLANLRAQLINKLIQEALVQLQSEVPNGDILLSPTLTLSEILDETSFPLVGEPGNDLDLSMQIIVNCQLVSGKVLQDFVIPIMNSNTPASYSALDNSLKIVPTKALTLDQDGKVYWTVSTTRQLQPTIPAGRIIDLVIGKSVSQAVHQLSISLPISGQPDIVIAPSWWPRMPLLSMRIQVLQAQTQ